MLDLKIVGAQVVSDGRSGPADVGVEGRFIAEVAPLGVWDRRVGRSTLRGC